MEYQIEALYRLVAEVYQMALRDARKNRTDAIWFLDNTFPEWRKFAESERTRKARLNETGSNSVNVRVRVKTRKMAHPVGLPQEQTERG